MELISRKKAQILNEHEIITTGNQKNGAAKVTNNTSTFFGQLKNIDIYCATLERVYGLCFVEAIIKNIVYYMTTSKYIPGLVISATSNPTYHSYSLVANLVRLGKRLLDPLCRLSDANYYIDDLKSELVHAHLDSRALFLQDAFITIVGPKSADRNITNPPRRGSFPTTVF